MAEFGSKDEAQWQHASCLSYNAQASQNKANGHQIIEYQNFQICGKFVNMFLVISLFIYIQQIARKHLVTLWHA